MQDNRVPEKIYYYTDFNTFKLILENSTLRFKESTTSNDLLDTKGLYERLAHVIVEESQKSAESETEKKFIRGYIENNIIENNRVSLVACFTTKPDSRMLWDAYTMHRKDRTSIKYNGVCIEFNSEELEKLIKKSCLDYKVLMPVMYGDALTDRTIQVLIEEYSKQVNELKKDPDQSQDIVKPIHFTLFTKTIEYKLKKCIVIPFIKFVDGLDKLSPFCKHSFWSEEAEIRGLLSIKRTDIDLYKEVEYWKNDDDTGYYYCDLPINSKCISKVILGPEFDDEDKKSLNRTHKKIKLKNLMCVNSEGTGVITNR